MSQLSIALNNEFLFSFIRVLLETDTPDKLSDRDAKEIFEAIRNVGKLDPKHRRLLRRFDLRSKDPSDRLTRWAENGQ